METRQAVFFEDKDVAELGDVNLEEKRVYVPAPTIPSVLIPIPNMRVTSNEDYNVVPQHVEDTENNENPQDNEGS